MNLSPLPVQKFFGNDGQPLVGGQLFTYVAGTSTKQATYTDSSGGTPNTNPIVLDYRGEARVWIDPTLSYKFVLAPATDTDPPTHAIWTVDNITAAPANQDNAAVDTGSVNAIALAIPQISSPVAFTRIVFKVAYTNTGPVTITINGGTAKAFKYQNTAAFAGGEIIADGIYEAVYDGAQWQLQGPAVAYWRTSEEVTAGVTPTNYTVPSHEQIGIVDAQRYGFSASASGATNYTALVNAHAVAVQAGCGMHTPGGTFSYTPTAAINLAVNWENPTMTTLNCAMSSYSGIVFQQIQSTKIRNLYLNRTGTLQGTAIYQAPTTVSDFTGYQVLDNVWAIGFGRNLQIGNVFLNSYKNCRFNSGTTGIYCVPDSSTGNGYVTTLHFDTCEVLGNAQNHLFTSTLQSRGVMFSNCSGENPTTTASTFTRVRGLHFENWYGEGSNTIKNLILNDCSASFDGMCYLNGTAGITLGTNTEARFKGIRIGTSTDVLTGGDGTQTVSMEDCQWPGSGNSISFLCNSMVNTSINGVWYGTGLGSFTGTLTGCTTSPTASIAYTVNNNTVTAFLPVLTATSNATTCTITGVPAAIRPTTTQFMPSSLIYDNTTSTTGIISVNSSGVIAFSVGVNSSGFTAAGTKGVILPIVITWTLS